MADAINVHITCLCGKVQEALPVSSRLPVETTSCSCGICRYSTGVLYVACLPLAASPASTENLAVYPSSTKLARYFCRSCGTHMFIYHQASGSWKVCSGTVDRIVAADPQPDQLNLEKILQHEFVAETVDGGISVCLSNQGGQPILFYAQGPDEEPIKFSAGMRLAHDPADQTMPLQTTDRSNQPDLLAQSLEVSRLHASCHCGGVEYSVTRPTAQSKACSSPWPDLLVPYHSASSANPDDIKWWLRASDRKYLAGTCACRSCRLASGFPIQSWAFIPKANLLGKGGQPIDFDAVGSTRYNSSPGVFREFCGTCGATAFWHCEERPGLIDVSVGLLRAPEGARAESWLEWWTERVSFIEEAFDKPLISALESGLKNLKAR